jgi:hypothetical protein
MIIVGDSSSRLEKDGALVARFDNKLAWVPTQAGRSIIAVGGAQEWLSTKPLPREAVLTDLVVASTGDPDLAAALWGPFLAYLCYSARPTVWRRALLLLALGLVRIPVQVDVSDSAIRSAVQDAITRSRYHPRFVVRGTVI